jgi:hypothetical protein
MSLTAKISGGLFLAAISLGLYTSWWSEDRQDGITVPTNSGDMFAMTDSGTLAEVWRQRQLVAERAHTMSIVAWVLFGLAITVVMFGVWAKRRNAD